VSPPNQTHVEHGPGYIRIDQGLRRVQTLVWNMEFATSSVGRLLNDADVVIFYFASFYSSSSKYRGDTLANYTALALPFFWVNPPHFVPSVLDQKIPKQIPCRSFGDAIIAPLMPTLLIFCAIQTVPSPAISRGMMSKTSDLWTMASVPFTLLDQDYVHARPKPAILLRQLPEPSQDQINLPDNDRITRTTWWS